MVSTWADVTLEGLLHERDGLTTEHALHLLEQCLASLGPIAANGFSHGGLTPQDLGVTESEVLIDTLRMTTTSARLEAQAYLAPEVVGTGTQPDPRSDIYTIGVIAYRMLLGRDRFGRTFEHNQPGIALPALSVLRPDIPAAICHVIERMVLPEAADRFSSATLAHQALKEALDVSDLERSSDPSGVDTPSPANVSTHDVENEPVGRELAPSAPSLASPTEITAPERARQHRSALPAFVTVALLLITIGGAWYAWQFIYEKKNADVALTAVTEKREAAQRAQANIHALARFAGAERLLGEAREAYYFQRFTNAAELAGEARVEYEKARDTALERGAYQALAKASAAYESAVSAEEINTTGLNVQLAALRAAELSLENGDYFDAKDKLTEVENLIGALLSDARRRTLNKKIASLSAEVSAQTLSADNAALVVIKEQLEAARNASSPDDYETASSHYREAQTLFQRSIDQTRWQQVEILKRETQRTRQTVITTGAASSSRSAEADLKWQIAMEALQDRDSDESERAFLSARSLYESLLAEQTATHARDQARQERDRITDLDSPVSETELASGDAQLAVGDRQMERQDFPAAAATFAKAGATYREIFGHALREQVGRLHESTLSAGKKARSSGAEMSSRYQEALIELRQAETLIGNDEHQAARALLEQARQQFDLSELVARAIGAEHRLNQARAKADSNRLSPETPGFEMAESRASEGRAAMVAESYDLAIEHFAAAATAMERSIQDALRAHAERAKTRAFGLLEEVGDHVEPSEPKLKAAKERLSVAQTDYDAANFATSIVLFDEAATLLGELQEKIAATRAEQGMKDALARAFAAGISGELGELAVGLSHRTTGEQRQAENKSGEARIAFELATKAFEQAIIVELEIRALRARDATAAVRKSVTGSGAAPLERFARANEQFDKATAALTLGNYEAAYEIFRRAQNGFDQAALEWAANKAAGAAGVAMEQARLAGISASDSTMTSAAQSIERAELILSEGAFGEAAELLVATSQTLEALVENRKTSEVATARAESLDAKSRIPAGYQTSRLLEGEQTFIKATEALTAGELSLALSRFNAATDHFEAALTETVAMEGRTMAASAHAAVKTMGARETDILFAQGKEREQAGVEHLAVLRFSEATKMFVLARESFDDLQLYLTRQTRQFVAGSTSAERSLAIDLCRSQANNCSAELYEAEVEREVSLRPFAIDDHEVSNEEFAEFVRAEGYETDAERLGYSMRAAGPSSIRAPGHSWRSPRGRGTNYLRYPTHPVVHVSYEDASAYCRWSGGRLPREAEWEYAARGDDRRQFAWGHNWQPDLIRWGGEPSAGPMPVRAFPASSTPEGVHDMSGNVWEWTQTLVDGGAVLKGGCGFLETQPVFAPRQDW